jgi:DNA-binding transcriptional ArsR family regulator
MAKPRQLDSTLVVRTAALVADPARAAILQSLSDGRPRPAGELARRAGVSFSTASAHLARLLDGGLLGVEREGRHRYYRLGDPEQVVGLLETLAALAPVPPASGPVARALEASPIRRGRTCYNHLAGILGVSITDALLRHEWLALEGRTFELTVAGEAGLAELGVDVAAARRTRATFARACLDWSERRYHLAGALGAALCTRLFELCWIERADGGRVTHVTTGGRRALRRRLGLELW